MLSYRSVFLYGALALLIAGCSQEKPSQPAEEPVVQGETDYGDEEGLEMLAKSDGIARFEVTFENLTPATGEGSSQPFSPPVFAVHTGNLRLWKLGHRASDELRQIAEDAVNGPMMAKLASSGEVYSVSQGTGVIFPGASETFVVEGEGQFHRFSLVSMLVNTNDGFTGVTRVFLPVRGKRVFYLKANDAGTEKNTELKDHIPGPCCGSHLVRVPTDDKVRRHKGIKGIGDLDPAIYGWDEPVAKLTIRRVR